jgi:cytochrome c-type biogenesis protein
MTALLISSFLAWILTILAPCVLPVLPVVLAGSVTERQRWYPYLVTLSLAGSIVLFTVILKATTALIDIPPSFWKYLSWGILLALGLVYIFPHAWSWIGGRLGFGRSGVALDHTQDIGSPALRAIATGAALGPVFSTCSPTYSLLLATVFPVSLLAGIGYTLVYALGLALMLTIIAVGGRSIIARFRGVASENWWFKRILGIIFVLIGLAIITGIDKQIESRALDIWNPSSLEEGLLDTLMPHKEPMSTSPTLDIVPVVETPSSIVPVSPEITPTSPIGEAVLEKAPVPIVVEPIPEKKIVPSTPPSPPVIVAPVKPQVVPQAQTVSETTVQPAVSIESAPTVEKISPAIEETRPAPSMSIRSPYSAPELRGLSNWINSDPLTLASLRWQVVIVDFWTFWCSNCQAVLPRVQALYEKYRSEWLTIIGVHAPEFAYEQKYTNVLSAVQKAWLTYPIVLDNDFSTWNAYSNQYWPAMYIIDRSGKVRHTHFGEGQYAEIDEIVGYLLSEK